MRLDDRTDIRSQLRVLLFAAQAASCGEVLQAANPLTRLVQSLQDRFASPPEASFGLTGVPLQSSVVTSAMNNRRWYPVSRLAPEQIKVSKHSMDPSMTVLLPGVETATAMAASSYHITEVGKLNPG